MVETVIVHFWTAPGKEAEMKAVLLEAAETYLKDPGTLNWFVMQDPKDPSAWSIVERYEDEAAMKVHFENPHFKKFMTDVGPLTEGTQERQILTYTEL
ncbi:hypothetical protein K438DRAFT_1807993 [Mycena galopus ATCC 62051]|nr:hypothetical protein K438DRAFT_1807993 [Mycena galopus ATCC 62051]